MRNTEIIENEFLQFFEKVSEILDVNLLINLFKSNMRDQLLCNVFYVDYSKNKNFPLNK